jgi:DNA-binding transcriptional LysR family regulator
LPCSSSWSSSFSVCAQIIDLETEIGTWLFERTHQRVSLTVAGRTFVSGARKTLESALQAVETAQQASLDYRGELRIANVGLMCPALLAQLISAFRERFPNVEVTILQQSSFRWIQAAQKRADLGIGYVAAELTDRPLGMLKSRIITTPFRKSVHRSRLSQAHGACGTFSAQPGVGSRECQSVSERLSKCGSAIYCPNPTVR